MTLTTISPSLIPSSAGVNVTQAESLAHAVETFAGALTAYLIAASWQKQLAYPIDALYLCGGAAASFMIPAPAWLIALDLPGAYLA